MYQELAWHWTVLLISIVIITFALAAVGSRKKSDYGPIQSRGYRIRSWFFIALLVLGIPILFGTLVFTSLPYASATAPAAKEYQIVHAVGHQWRWELDNIRLQANQPVEFRVTSGDVNHGFGIYDSSLRLLTQIQAMPGYTNVMRYTFQTPGTYKVMCLEYCGLAHHGMLAELTVTE